MEYKGSSQYHAGLSWIAITDAAFCQRYGYDQAEYEGWRSQWLQSGRAREYGLNVQAEGIMARRHAARDRGRKASVAARRQRRLAGDAGAAAADQQAEA